MRGTAMLVVLAACTGGQPQPRLRLDGPARVKVDTLGKVDGPRAVGPEGVEPEGVLWTVSPTNVAHIVDGQVVAVGRGEAVVTGQWHEQQVEWHLVVEPTISLAFDNPPAQIAVGDKQTIGVKATVGGQPTDTPNLEWAVQPQGLAHIENGVLEGVKPGRVWVTAKHGTSEAMAEIDVVVHTTP